MAVPENNGSAIVLDQYAHHALCWQLDYNAASIGYKFPHKYQTLNAKCGIEGHHLQDISGGGDGDSSSTALPPRVAPALCHPATTACIHMMRYKIQTPKSIFIIIIFLK